MTGKYFDVPRYEGGFEDYGAVVASGKSAPLSASLTTRRRFFQSAAGSRWDEELNVVDERVERALEALKYQVRAQDLVGIVDRGRIGEDGDDEDDEDDEVAMSVDS